MDWMLVIKWVFLILLVGYIAKDGQQIGQFMKALADSSTSVVNDLKA